MLKKCKWLKAYFLWKLEPESYVAGEKNSKPVKNGPAPQHWLMVIIGIRFK